MALTQVDAGLLNSTAQYTGFKNRIINGAMQIDQRNAGASVTGNNGVFLTDRFRVVATQTSKLTGQQNAGSVTPPVGYTNYLGITSSSAYSVASGDVFAITQPIEGFNIADLGWGTASAKTVTLSAWVYSSLTGTFGGSLQNGSTNRAYPFSYTVSSANTWTQINITIAGDTTGTWATNNTQGILVSFALGAGSTFSGTAGAWAAANQYSATGATSVVGTSGATFYITGVQLEKGSVATSFDYRPYTTELQLCQRYYEVLSVDTNNATWSWTSGPAKFFSQFFPFVVVKRAVPTGTATFSNSKFVIPGTIAVDGTAVHTMSNYTSTTIGFNAQVPGVATISATNAYSYSYEGSFQINSSAEL